MQAQHSALLLLELDCRICRWAHCRARGAHRAVFKESVTLSGADIAVESARCPSKPSHPVDSTVQQGTSAAARLRLLTQLEREAWLAAFPGDRARKASPVGRSCDPNAPGLPKLFLTGQGRSAAGSTWHRQGRDVSSSLSFQLCTDKLVKVLLALASWADLQRPFSARLVGPQAGQLGPGC